MKKGITVQPFLFIMALVAMAFVITFGTKALLDLKRTAELTELGVFVDTLDDEAEKFYNFEVGSSKDIAISLPTRVTAVCLLNPGKPITAEVPDPFLRSVLEGSRRSNAFILPLHAFQRSDFYIEHLRVREEKNPLCVDTRGKLEIALETVLHQEQVYVEIRER